MNVVLLDADGKDLGLKEVSFEISAEGHKGLHAIKQAVVGYLAHQRQGNHSTKSRAEVTGSDRKPWKQKGTGRARQGSRLAPQWRGGGVTFGPKPHKYAYDVNSKVARLARESAIKIRIQEGKVVIVKDIKLAEPKTKNAKQLLKNLKVHGSVLVVVQTQENLLRRAFNNLENAKLMRVQDLNAYDILRYRNLVVSEAVFDGFRLSDEVSS